MVVSITFVGGKIQSLIAYYVKEIPIVCPDSSKIQCHWVTCGCSIFRRERQVFIVCFIHTMHNLVPLTRLLSKKEPSILQPYLIEKLLQLLDHFSCPYLNFLQFLFLRCVDQNYRPDVDSAFIPIEKYIRSSEMNSGVPYCGLKCWTRFNWLKTRFNYWVEQVGWTLESLINSQSTKDFQHWFMQLFIIPYCFTTLNNLVSLSTWLFHYSFQIICKYVLKVPVLVQNPPSYIPPLWESSTTSIYLLFSVLQPVTVLWLKLSLPKYIWWGKSDFSLKLVVNFGFSDIQTSFLAI